VDAFGDDPMSRLAENPYDTRPRKSARLAAKPRVSQNTFEEDSIENDRKWSEYVQIYADSIQEHLPSARAKTLMMYVAYFDDRDAYVNIELEVLPLLTRQLTAPANIYHATVQTRQFFGTGLQWLCESKDKKADLYFKAVAAVLMFKDVMRVICNMGVHLPDSLWMSGRYLPSVDKSEYPYWEKQKAKAMSVFENWVGDWPEKSFTRKPTSIPFKVETNFVDIAAFGFDDYVQSYLRVVGRLEDFQREFGELGKVVDLSKYVAEETESKEAALFEAVVRGPEDYRAFKDNIYDRITKDPDVDVPPATLDFLKNTAPAPLQPIHIHMPPAPSSEGGSFGTIGGVMFTLWLLSNMS
jgi:hypothetical protein